MNEIELKTDGVKKSKTITISSIIPFLGSFIIFLGMLRLMLYYRSFGISIVSYLDFSEIITSFLDIIVFVVPMLIIAVVQAVLQKRENEVERNNKLEKKVLLEDKLLKRLLLYLGISAEFLIVGVLNSVIMFFASEHRDFQYVIWTLLLYIICFFLLLVIPTELEIKHRKFKHSESFRFILKLLLIAGLFILFIAIYVSKEIEYVKEDKKYFGVRIVLENDQEIVSDSTKYYIGKTQNFVFFFNEIESETTVLPMNRVKVIQYKYKQKKNGSKELN